MDVADPIIEDIPGLPVGGPELGHNHIHEPAEAPGDQLMNPEKNYFTKDEILVVRKRLRDSERMFNQEHMFVADLNENNSGL